MSYFQGITTTSIIGDETSGVQGRFPKFKFDDDSRPSLAQVTQYTASAINNMLRMVRKKGYFPEQVYLDEDLRYVSDLIELMVAGQIHTVLDQGKGGAAISNINLQLETALKIWHETEDPFPLLKRMRLSEEEHIFPARMVRGQRPVWPGVAIVLPLAALNFRNNIIPTGVIDGVNTKYTLPDVPNPTTSVVLQLNGRLLNNGVDYSVNLNQITILNSAFIPQPARTVDGLAVPADTFVAVLYTYLLNQVY